jgi:secreted trypsin-like serine protease
LRFFQGFGITEDGIAPGGVTEVDVNIISNEDCQIEMNGLKKKYGKEANEALPDGLTPAILCTKGRWNKKKNVFTGPCDGDDGGPLYINQKINSDGDIEDRTLVAINSGSLGKCGRENFPAWWTRIASYIDWLECIQVEAATPAHNEEIDDKIDQTHLQIEEKCKSKLPPLPKKPF